MMGLPEGWVTDTPGLKRADHLTALGNGVVPQQAVHALTRILDSLATLPPAPKKETPVPHTSSPAPARARTTDPVTSHEAAADVTPRRPRLREHILNTLKHSKHGTARQPFTLTDVVTLYQERAAHGEVPPASDSGIRTRVSELMRDDLIRRTGTFTVINGRRAHLLEITPTDHQDDPR